MLDQDVINVSSDEIGNEESQPAVTSSRSCVSSNFQITESNNDTHTEYASGSRFNALQADKKD